ncbi:MAG: hypothetical protein ACE1ZA_12615 [Pseudomonadales bacterium]
MRIVMLAALLVGSISAHGYMRYGHGNKSCGEWTQIQETADAAAVTQWVLGWISAAGYYAVAKGIANDSGLLVTIDSQAIVAWVDDYCRRKPLNTVAHAAEAAVKELAERAG